ncbi:hypothetical protein [Tunturiibacter psychrotolerans]
MKSQSFDGENLQFGCAEIHDGLKSHTLVAKPISTTSPETRASIGADE